ncbi:MAG: hypothetical protein KDC07_11215 [Chitinophagaceae bacterium]|nr:hypothetical protein [Chitinophagaceae bacterium]MCB9045462.1 hypothetical protein [Chitinophagales bacterium]
MKKIASVIVLSVIVNQCMAQPLEAEELLDMLTCNDYACISGKVIPLGYEVALNKETAGYQTYTFTSKTVYQNESNNKIMKPYKVNFTDHTEDSAITLNYVIGDKVNREMLLAAFKELGFRYDHATKTKSTFDNTATVYKSERYPGWVLKVTNYDKREGRHTHYLDYDFELWRFTGKRNIYK